MPRLAQHAYFRTVAGIPFGRDPGMAVCLTSVGLSTRPPCRPPRPVLPIRRFLKFWAKSADPLAAHRRTGVIQSGLVWTSWVAAHASPRPPRPVRGRAATPTASRTGRGKRNDSQVGHDGSA